LGSDYTGSQTKLPKILLNGNNICMVGHQALLFRLTLTSGQLIPGGEGPVATAT
jgi:U6 snRNA-associated Sm-like protein LSm5